MGNISRIKMKWDKRNKNHGSNEVEKLKKLNEVETVTVSKTLYGRSKFCIKRILTVADSKWLPTSHVPHHNAF